MSIADLDAEVGEPGADALDGPEGRQEVGGELHGLFLGGARLVDLAHRQQLRPVGDRTVGHGVQAEVGHSAVPARRRDEELRLAHGRLFEPEHGLRRLQE